MKKFQTYFDRHPPRGRFTKKDFRNHVLHVYSTGKKDEWYVRIWMGERKSHGMSISDTFKTKNEADNYADKLTDYISDVFIVKEIRTKEKQK